MIGLFDSGSGGLSVLAALRKKAPRASVVYFGDIANAPYGERSAESLAHLAREGVELLRSRGATSLVSACNSVSSSVLAGAAGDSPLIEMSMPTARFLARFPGKRFLLMATPATVASRLYEKAVGNVVRLDALPIPALAAAIEFGRSEGELERVLRAAFSTRAREAYEGLILGCTHYPLVAGLIARVAKDYFGDLLLIDPAYPVAEAIVATFDTAGDGSMTFLLSAPASLFEERVKKMFPNAPFAVELARPGTGISFAKIGEIA